MKKATVFVLTLALLATLVSGFAAHAEVASKTLDFPESGFTYEAPGSWKDTIGQIDAYSDRGEFLGYDTGVVLGYVIYRGRTDEEAAQYEAFAQAIAERDEDPTEEEMAVANEYNSRNAQIFEVYGLRDGMTLDDMISSIMEGKNLFKDTIELGKHGEYTYWLVTYDLDNPFVADLIKDWSKEMVDELRTLEDDAAAHPERIALKDREIKFVPPAIGSTIEFETTDLNGNPVSSRDLFAQNKVTLVNIWRTWCGPCVAEMPELDALNAEYAPKGAAVVTYCGDANSPELIDKAREITKDYGFNTLVWSESFDAALPWNCTPMTYFVDSEGKVLSYPVKGSNMDACVANLEAALNGKTPETTIPPKPEADAQETASYIIAVVDQNGEAVPGVAVSFCTADNCDFAVSDDQGIITYEGAPISYHIDILSVPDGYSFEALDDVYTDTDSSSMTMTITKD